MRTPGPVVGLDIGGRQTKMVLVDGKDIIARANHPTPKGPTTGIADLVVEFLADRPIAGLAVAVAAHVDGRSVAMGWDHQPQFAGLALSDALESRFDLDVVVENDARAAGVGEYWWVPEQRERRLLALTLGTGLGVAMMLDGRLLDPDSDGHLAGHLPTRHHEHPCFCGLEFCLEPLLSSSRLDSDAARLGDSDWAAVLAEPVSRQSYLDDLGTGLTALVHVFAPRVVVFGGGLAALLEPLLQEVSARVTTEPAPGYTLRLITTQLEGYAGALGAASLASGTT